MRTGMMLGCFLFSLAAMPVCASTLTIDVSACIDGVSKLIIEGDTLQWDNISYRVPGNPVNCTYNQTFVSTTFDGFPILSDDAWIPTWPSGVPDSAFAENVFSSTFTDLSPMLPISPLSVTLDAIQARYALTISQLPTTGNGGVLILDFNDGPPGGPATYEGVLTITTTPEPSTYLFVGIATAAIVLKRSRRRWK
jgi:hypothetical protein